MTKAFAFTDDDRNILQSLIDREKRTTLYSRNRPSTIVEDYGAPEVYVALTPDGGIPPLVADKNVGTGTGSGTGLRIGDKNTPGYADCYCYRIIITNGVPDLFPVGPPLSHPPQAGEGLIQRVYNLSESRIEGDQWIVIARDKTGYWYVISDGGGCYGLISAVTNVCLSYGTLTVERSLIDTCTGHVVARKCIINPHDCCTEDSGTGTGSGTALHGCPSNQFPYVTAPCSNCLDPRNDICALCCVVSGSANCWVGIGEHAGICEHVGPLSCDCLCEWQFALYPNGLPAIQLFCNSSLGYGFSFGVAGFLGNVTTFTCEPFLVEGDVVVPGPPDCTGTPITLHLRFTREGCTGTGTGTGTGSCGPPITTNCCPSNPIPCLLHATLTGTDCSTIEGTYPIPYSIGSSYIWNTGTLSVGGLTLAINLICDGAGGWTIFADCNGATRSAPASVSCSPPLFSAILGMSGTDCCTGGGVLTVSIGL